MYELVWSGRFEADVQSIYEWLEERNDGAGDRFYRKLLSDLEQLKKYPWSGSRTENSNARRLLVIDGRYAAIHTVEYRGIILQTLFDQQQDPAIRIRIVRQITGGLPGPRPAE